ncbi:MAG TPA: MFS transporter, partial [Allocoleopsis sp.]
CGLSPDVGWLIGFRALQGLGAVMIAALGAAIVTEVFPSSERGRALGIIGAIVSLGIALGPTVGGFLIAVSGWRLIFLVNVPIGIFASFVVARSIPTGTAQPGQRFDLLGLIILAITLFCFAMGMTFGQEQGFTSSTSISLLSVAAIGLLGFVWLESRLKQPMLDLYLFRNLYFSLSLLTGLLVFVVIAGALLITPFFLELVLHFSTRHVGLLLGFSPVLTGIVAPFAGQLSDRFGSRPITLMGLLLLTIACLSLSTLHEGMTDLEYLLRVVPFGIGMGMFQSPNNSAILGEVPPERLGIASGLMALSRTLGQTAGYPLMGTIFALLTLQGTTATDVVNAAPGAMVAGVKGTFLIGAGIMLVAGLLVALLWWMEKRKMKPLTGHKL